MLDFYAPARQLAIEIDGAAHDLPAQAIRDVLRDRWLQDHGIRVLRLNASDILDPHRRDDMVETILAASRKA